MHIIEKKRNEWPCQWWNSVYDCSAGGWPRELWGELLLLGFIWFRQRTFSFESRNPIEAIMLRFIGMLVQELGFLTQEEDIIFMFVPPSITTDIQMKIFTNLLLGASKTDMVICKSTWWVELEVSG